MNSKQILSFREMPERMAIANCSTIMITTTTSITTSNTVISSQYMEEVCHRLAKSET